MDWICQGETSWHSGSRPTAEFSECPHCGSPVVWHEPDGGEWDMSRCHSCGERFRPDDERAEIMRYVMPVKRMLVHQACMQEGDSLA